MLGVEHEGLPAWDSEDESFVGRMARPTFSASPLCSITAKSVMPWRQDALQFCYCFVDGAVAGNVHDSVAGHRDYAVSSLKRAFLDIDASKRRSRLCRDDRSDRRWNLRKSMSKINAPERSKIEPGASALLRRHCGWLKDLSG